MALARLTMVRMAELACARISHLANAHSQMKVTAIVMALEVEVKLEVETGAGRGSESAATDVARLMMVAVKMQPALPGW